MQTNPPAPYHKGGRVFLCLGIVPLLCKDEIRESVGILFILFLYKKTRPENDSKRVLARNERLELPTPGFGDQCSTN